jgi:hypothetical protein
VLCAKYVQCSDDTTSVCYYGSMLVLVSKYESLATKAKAPFKVVSGHSDLPVDGMGSIPSSPDARRNVPLLLCQELFNEASLPESSVRSYITHSKGELVLFCNVFPI